MNNKLRPGFSPPVNYNTGRLRNPHKNAACLRDYRSHRLRIWEIAGSVKRGRNFWGKGLSTRIKYWSSMVKLKSEIFPAKINLVGRTAAIGFSPEEIIRIELFAASLCLPLKFTCNTQGYIVNASRSRPRVRYTKGSSQQISP